MGPLFHDRTLLVRNIAGPIPYMVSSFIRNVVGRSLSHPFVCISHPQAHIRFSLRMVQGVSIDDGCLVDLNPATEEIIARVPCSTRAEVDSMVNLANKQRSTWKDTPATERISLLRKGLEALSTKADELAELITKEMGKPISEAREEVQFATQKSKYFDIMEAAMQDRRHGSSVVVRQPFGVAAIISPWNFPADEILLLLLPALGSGNTAIVKASEVTPLTAQLVVNTLQEVLPLNVVNIAQGDGSVGQQLVDHDDVHFVAMTGSSVTGKRILEAASRTGKKVVLEMGGKDPMIVFGDADLEKAAKDAVAYSLANTGQVCCSIERIFIEESIIKDFSRLVVDQAKRYTVGNGMDSQIQVGPLVSGLQRDRVHDHVQDALDKGAEQLWKSSIPDGRGYFHPVTVLRNVKDGMKMYREETFGPVISLSPFDGSESEAIRLANDTEYGLASCVYTRDVEKAERVANAIETGQVGINCYSLDHMNPACPWVGHKSSGHGYHSGEEGFHQFSIPKTLVYLP